MKRVIFFVFVLHYVTISNSRLIEKVPEATTTTASQTPTYPIRSRRHFIDDSSAFQTKEVPFQNAFEKKSKTMLKSKRLLKDTSQRIPRQSNVTHKEGTAPVESAKKVLVKKPIPKFNDLDEYYIEPKSFKLARFVESDENEDEDFNLDDYDFDVKHDEYVGRGKPSIPRKDYNTTKDTAPEVLKVVRTVDTSSDSTVKVTKRRRLPKTEEKKHKEKDEVYDYDATTTTQKIESKDTEESKEYDRSVIVRAVRSASFKKNEFNDMFTIASVKRPVMLPMFPIQYAPGTERYSRKDIM